MLCARSPVYPVVEVKMKSTSARGRRTPPIIAPCPLLFLIVLLPTLLATGCRTTGSGQVRILLASDKRDLGELRSLVIEIESAGLHQAGKPVEEGWVTWTAVQRQADLAALTAGATVFVGEAEVPAGRYDRARVVVEQARAWTLGGHPVDVRVTVEPIATPLTLRPGQRVEIIIELIALGQPDRGYELFTKDVIVTDG